MIAIAFIFTLLFTNVVLGLTKSIKSVKIIEEKEGKEWKC
jgi:hypothetical protein